MKYIFQYRQQKRPDGFETAIHGDLNITALTPFTSATDLTAFIASSRLRGFASAIFATPTASRIF